MSCAGVCFKANSTDAQRLKNKGGKGQRADMDGEVLSSLCRSRDGANGRRGLTGGLARRQDLILPSCLLAQWEHSHNSACLVHTTRP